VERITASAGVNNALLYRYFGNKSDLFETVFGALTTTLVEAIGFTPDDLPAYAGALVDYCAEHPEVIRLAAWHRLEPGDRPLPEVVRKSLEDRIVSIEEAQAAGRLTTTYPAAELLSLIHGLSLSQTAADVTALWPDTTVLTEHKRMVTAAVAAILAS